MLAASCSFMPLPRTIMPISRCAVVLYSSPHQNQPVLAAFQNISHHCISHSLVNHGHPCLLTPGSAATYVSYPRLIGPRLSPHPDTHVLAMYPFATPSVIHMRNFCTLPFLVYLMWGPCSGKANLPHADTPEKPTLGVSYIAALRYLLHFPHTIPHGLRD